MLRTDVADDLRDSFGEDGYLFPDYEGYCFGNVPHTITSMLGVDTGRTLPDDALAGVDTDAETVVVVLVDGFGFEQWRRERGRHPFLDRLSTEARVTPLTSVYPSETAAAMNTFHTGRLPAEHGVIGWNVYEPAADAAFEALPFRTKDGEEPTGIAREDVADADSLYPELADEGVSTHHVVPFETTAEGATAHTYETLAEFVETVPEAVRATGDPGYCFAYLPHVDAEAHASGTESASYRETAGEVFDALSDVVSELAADGTAEDALVAVAADHGHVNTDPERNVNLDRYDELVAALRRHEDGSPVRFSGSPRNVHLHLRDGPAREVAADLRADLGARAFEREAVLDRELFGDVDPSETFRRRLGDVVLVHRRLGTWYRDAEPDELRLVGMHGGLHPDEMLVPFALGRMDGLVA